MRSRRRYPLYSLILTALLLLPAAPAPAATKILSAPGFPFFLVMELGYGDEVRELVLRTPSETKTFEAFRGMTYAGQTPLLSYTDRDWHKDLLWQVSFLDRRRPGKSPTGKDLWIGSTTGNGKIWVGSTETSPSLWDQALLSVRAPEGTGFLTSPHLPSPSPDAPFHPENHMTFVYTLRLTREGPRFVIIPDVYRQLASIADLIRRCEEDPVMRKFYDDVFQDFASMSEGRLPSVVTLARFPWKNMGYGQMRP